MTHEFHPHGQIDPADYYLASLSGSRAERAFHGARLRLIERAAEVAGRSVLDVGCGTGCLAVPLARRAARVVGIDLSAEHVAMLKDYALEAGVTVEGVVGSGAELPFPDDSFEVVLVASVVHLVPEPGPILREAERVCRRDGRIVVAGPWRWHPKASKTVKRLLGKKVVTTSWPFTVERVQRGLLRSRLTERIVDRAMGYVATVWVPDGKPRT